MTTARCGGSAHGLALVERSRCRLADEPRGSSGGGKLNRHFFDLLVAGNELTVARRHGQHQPAILESAPKFARMFETASDLLHRASG